MASRDDDEEEYPNYKFSEHDSEDFSEGSESSPAHSVDLIQCPRCRKYCHELAQQCPHCKHWMTDKDTWRSKPAWYVVTVWVTLLACFGGLLFGAFYLLMWLASSGWRI